MTTRVLHGLGALLLWLQCRGVAGQISQSSSPGQIAEMSFDMTVSGGDMYCGALHAMGDLTLIDARLDFDSHFYDFFSQPADMFIQVEVLDDTGSVAECFIYGGYDYNSEGCGKAGKWPEGWHSTNDGAYTAKANTTRAHFSGSTWSICLGNGWTGSTLDVTYKGSLSLLSLLTIDWAPSLLPSAFPSSSPTHTLSPTMLSEAPSSIPSQRPSSPPQESFPTGEPSASLPDTMALTSPCGALVTLQFDAYLRGTQNVCVNFGANSTLNYVNITMDYGGNGDEIAGDMAFIVYHSTSLFGVQVGGHDYYIPTVMYAGPWPSTWQSSDPGRYVANVDISAGNLGGGEGYYYACILNGWFYGGLEHYSGTLQLDSLVTQCDLHSDVPSIAPSTGNERFSSDDDRNGSEQTAIILASVLVPGLLIITAVIAFCLWRKRNNEAKTTRQSMVAAELSEISKDVSRSARAMSSQPVLQDEDDDSDEEDSNSATSDEEVGSRSNTATSAEKQRLAAYKKHQKNSSKKGNYEPPGIANPLLRSLEADVKSDESGGDDSSLW